jgi:uncharacterized Zn-finger protein
MHSLIRQISNINRIKYITSRSLTQQRTITHHLYKRFISESATADYHSVTLHICAQCCRHFNTKKELQDHAQLHTKEYTCHVCGNQYKHRRTLREHLRVHSELTASSLQRHQQWKHEQSPPLHKCTHPGCEQVFRTKQVLDKHMERHSENLPYACPYCAARFQYRTSATKHSKHSCPKRPIDDDEIMKGMNE